MKTTQPLQKVMNLAWQFVRNDHYTMSEALKCAWLNSKLQAEMEKRVVCFFFQRVDGKQRMAFGTLEETLLPPLKGTNKKPNEGLQVYFDIEFGEFRSFRKANLVRVA
ncbi:SH3 beta-barrel fold-containing protein [Bacteroides sp. 224]|uniref:SH3 beta-barrel fold-containing protein n=1 Tax=Bacteroides sp. 224 TaxID=2302936 RepID=UPI0013D62D38|nr:SH3 beta-barrel fold-containing protein [Bacteroides sp. 224]NDV65038.1 DUF2693 domain-containing protein [Bacteroides sp. 224]